MPIHDPVALADEFAQRDIGFTLVPAQWRQYTNAAPLSWTQVKFTDAGLSTIPTLPGIYAFVIRHANILFPPHGYIMYIGITDRTLRKRYREYLNEQARCKRPHIHRLLTRFVDDVEFYYSAQDATVDLEALETDLLGAILPPLNKKDFPVHIQKARAAQW